MEYYSAIKEEIWVSPNEVEKPRACYMEWSKSEREKQKSYINIYTWNLEKCQGWTYLQGSNEDKGIENRLVDTVWEGEGGTNWEGSMETYTLLKCCFWITQRCLGSWPPEEKNSILGTETRLDRSELLCNKVLLKYKGDRESFWHRHQKGAKEYSLC